MGVSMKRLTAYLTMCLLALSLAACSAAPTSQDVPDAGSVVGSVQAATPKPAAEEPEAEEPAVPAYDPIDLERDNPLDDADIASVELRLHGVGTAELTGVDEQAMLEIIQNDARVYDDSITADNLGFAMSGFNYVSPPVVSVVLDSGEVLRVEARTSTSYSPTALAINDCVFELSDEEYGAFASLVDTYREKVLDSVDGKIKPCADLTAEDLVKVKREGETYLLDTEPSGDLTDEQITLVIEALNELEIEPATAEFELPILMGGGYEYFELWFKDGDHFYVGDASSYEYGEDGRVANDIPQAYIDGALYSCNPEYTTDMYWTYEETRPGYVRQYLNARNVPEYPFEELTVDEVVSIHSGLDAVKDGSQTDLVVPLTLADEVVDVLKQLRISDGNRVEAPEMSFAEAMNRGGQLTIGLKGEGVYLGVADGHAIVNHADYDEDPEVLDALQALIDHAAEEGEKLLASNGETQLIKASGGDVMNVSNGNGQGPKMSVRTYSFELSKKLVEHDDGYYPEVYTFEDAPIAVEVNFYESEMQTDPETYMTTYPVPDDAIVNRLKADMEAADGEGYTEDPYAALAGMSVDIIEHIDEVSGVHEKYIGCNNDLSGFFFEICIVERDADYEINFDSVWALLYQTLNNSWEPVE